MSDDPIPSHFDMLEIWYRIRDLEIDEFDEAFTNSELDLQVRELTHSDVLWFDVARNMVERAQVDKEAEGQ